MEKQPKLELEPSNSKRKYHRHDASVFSGGYVQHHNIVAWWFKNHFNSVFTVCAVSGAGCCKDTNTVELCAVFLLSKNQKASFPRWLNYQWLASERSFTSLYFITRRPTGLCNTTVQTQTHLVYA